MRFRPINRRQFLAEGGAVAALAMLSGCRSGNANRESVKPPGRLFFTTQGRTAVINADGTELRYFDFKVPDKVTWQPGPFLSDGRRVIFLSMEARRDGPGRPFDKFYHQTPTHLWLHDLDRGTLTEIATRDRLAPFYTPALLVSDERLLVQVVRDQGGQIFSMNLDGNDAREFTRLGEGLPYGLSLSPMVGASRIISPARRVTKSGPATSMARSASESRRIATIFTLARRGRRTDSGCSSRTATSRQTPATTGATSASRVRMGKTSVC